MGFNKFIEYKAKLKSRKIEFLQPDNGKEYINDHFENFLREHGIQRRLSMSNTLQQNDFSELIGKCRMIQPSLGPTFCTEVVNTPNYIRNFIFLCLYPSLYMEPAIMKEDFRKDSILKMF